MYLYPAAPSIVMICGIQLHWATAFVSAALQSSSREIIFFWRSLLVQCQNKIRDESPIHGINNTGGSIYAAANQHLYMTTLAKFT
jgi:hypothetical protein